MTFRQPPRVRRAGVVSGALAAVLTLVVVVVSRGDGGHASRVVATPAPTTALPSSDPPVPPPSPSTSYAPGVTVTSVSFVSADRGFVLGTVACHVGRCTRLETTADGGSTWTVVKTPPPGHPQQIRFATADVGYAFGDPFEAFSLTRDAGRTWTPVTVTVTGSYGRSGASDLEIAGGTTWLLTQAPYPDVEAAPVGSTAFHRVGGAGNRGAYLVVEGDTAYVVGPQGAGPVRSNLVIAGRTGTSSAVPLPCGSRGSTYDEASGFAALLTPDHLVVACGPTDPDHLQTRLLRSSDAGATWTAWGVLSPCRSVSAARTSSAVFVSCADGGIRRVSLTTGRTRMVLGVPTTYVGFTTDEDGVAIGDSSDPALYVTRDAGTHWQRAAL